MISNYYLTNRQFGEFDMINAKTQNIAILSGIIDISLSNTYIFPIGVVYEDKCRWNIEWKTQRTHIRPERGSLARD